MFILEKQGRQLRRIDISSIDKIYIKKQNEAYQILIKHNIPYAEELFVEKYFSEKEALEMMKSIAEKISKGLILDLD